MLMDWVGHHVDTAHWGLGFDQTGPWKWKARASFCARTVCECALAIPGESALRQQRRPRYQRRLRDQTRRHVVRRRRWIWVDRSGVDAKPRSVLMNKIRPDELHFERSTNHHRQFLECVKAAPAHAYASRRGAALGHSGLPRADLDSDQYQNSVGPGAATDSE